MPQTGLRLWFLSFASFHDLLLHSRSAQCLDCDSSPIWQLPARQQDLGFATIFTLNEPDLNGINPWQAADWYKQHINPLVRRLSTEKIIVVHPRCA
jgi:hypothetical protein